MASLSHCPCTSPKTSVFDLDALAARLSSRTKLIIVNWPNNPTGGIVGAEDLVAAAELIAQTPAWVLSDEVYSRLLYADRFCSIASVPGMLERTVVLDGLSKTHAMTGWRCGYACVPEPLVEPLTRFFVNSTSCVPPFIQYAGDRRPRGTSGPRHGHGRRVPRQTGPAGRALNDLPGVSCRTPQGAFYAFPNVSQLPISAEMFAERLLDQAGVAVLAGSAFGSQGADHLRLSYANSRDNLTAAVLRIEQLVAELL